MAKPTVDYLLGRVLLHEHPFDDAKTLYVQSGGSDTTGARGRLDKPFATIDAAIAAATAGDTIHIGVGTFVSPTTEKDGLTYLGAGQPVYNSLTNPTALTGGTVFQGPWQTAADNITVANLGVDVGSAVCTASYGGTAQEGLSFYDCTGSFVRDVTILCKASGAIHALRFEAGNHAVAENVQTFFGYHGLTIKSNNVQVRGHKAWGHDGDSCVIKADTGQTVTKIFVSDSTYLPASGLGVGMVMQANGGTLHDVHITNLSAVGVATAINILGANGTTTGAVYIDGVYHDGGGCAVDTGQLGGTTTDLFISNVYSNNPTTAGIRILSVTRAKISNFTQAGSGTWGMLLYSTLIQLVNVSCANTIYVDGGATCYGVNVEYGGLTGTIIPGISGLTSGGVVFGSTAGGLAQDAANLFWDNSNNRLGIGTNSPSHPVHLAIDQNADTQIAVSNSSAGAAASALLFSSNGTHTGFLGMRGTGASAYGQALASAYSFYTASPVGMSFIADHASAPILFAAGGNTTDLAIEASGHIGIGALASSVTAGGFGGGGAAVIRALIKDTTSGSYPQLAIQGPVDGGGAIEFYDASGTAVADFGVSIAGSNLGFVNRITSGKFDIYTHNGTALAQRFHISATGLIGIGTAVTSPAAQLHVVAPSAATVPLVVQGAAAQSANLQQWQDSAGNVRAYFSYDASGAAHSIMAVQGATYAYFRQNRGAITASAGNEYQTAGSSNWFMGTVENSNKYQYYCYGISAPSLQLGYEQSDARVVILGGSSQSGALLELQNSALSVLTAFDSAGKLSVFAGIADAVNIAVGTVTGTKIGTATTQKLGFYNATPVVQQSSTGEVTGFTAGSGTGVNDDSTFTGDTGSTAYTVGDIVKHLKTLGLIAA